MVRGPSVRSSCLVSIGEPSHDEIMAQVNYLCRHPLLEGKLRPHLLRFLVAQKLRGRFKQPYSKDKPQPNGRMIVFEFYAERAKTEGLRPPIFATYDDRPGKRLITGLIEAVREFYDGARGPAAKGAVHIEIPNGRGRAYEPLLSYFERPANSLSAGSGPQLAAHRSGSAGLGPDTGYPDPPEMEILGRWQYCVYSPDDSLSHCGDCQFLENGGRLVIRGDRRYRLAGVGSKSVVRVRSRWQTDWCEICRDGELRFVYHIDIQETKARTVKGFCQLGLGSEELIGTYHLLPPFDADVTNAKNGTIVFSRIRPEEEFSLPSGYVVHEPET